MTRRVLLRTAAVAAVVGVMLQVSAAFTELTVSEAPAEAMRQIAASDTFVANRMVDLVGAVLTLFALVIVAQTFRRGPAEEWSRAGVILLAVGFAIAGVAVMLGVARHGVAEAGVAADAAQQPAYVAAVDALGHSIGAVFMAVFIAIGAYLVTLAVSILVSREYPRWIGWVAGVGGALLLVGASVGPVIHIVFLLALIGFLLWMIVTAALGVKLWQKASTTIDELAADLPPAPAAGVAP
jgi:hypothetical protein